MGSDWRRPIRPEIITDTSNDTGSTEVESNKERCDRGLALLQKYISKDAFQDLRRDNESTSPESLSETDQVVLERIKIWLQDAERRKKFLWIGDTPSVNSMTTGSISHPLTAEEIEEICRDGGVFGASFSFSRRTAATTTIDQADAERARMSLVPTLAYQLAHTVAQAQQSIAEVGLKDPSVFTRSLVSQMVELIVKPLQALDSASSPDHQPRVVLIEGLSSVEGNDIIGTKEIVDAISQCSQDFTIPVGFIFITQTLGGLKMPKRYARVTRQ